MKRAATERSKVIQNVTLSKINKWVENKIKKIFSFSRSYTHLKIQVIYLEAFFRSFPYIFSREETFINYMKTVSHVFPNCKSSNLLTLVGCWSDGDKRNFGIDHQIRQIWLTTTTAIKKESVTRPENETHVSCAFTSKSEEGGCLNRHYSFLIVNRLKWDNLSTLVFSLCSSSRGWSSELSTLFYICADESFFLMCFINERNLNSRSQHFFSLQFE